MTALRRRSETYRIYRLCRCIEGYPGTCRCFAKYGTNQACFVVYFPRCGFVAETPLPNAALAWKPTTNNKASSTFAALSLVDHPNLDSRTGRIRLASNQALILRSCNRLFHAFPTNYSSPRNVHRKRGRATREAQSEQQHEECWRGSHKVAIQGRREVKAKGCRP